MGITKMLELRKALNPTERLDFSVLYWNDKTPTAEVLATLRRVAADDS
jgi:hypothetical protein